MRWNLLQPAFHGTVEKFACWTINRFLKLLRAHFKNSQMYFFRDFNKIFSDFGGGLDRLMLLISIPLMKNPWMVSNRFGTLSKDREDGRYFPAQWDCLVWLPWQQSTHPHSRKDWNGSLKSLLEFSRDAAFEERSL